MSSYSALHIQRRCRITWRLGHVPVLTTHLPLFFFFSKHSRQIIDSFVAHLSALDPTLQTWFCVLSPSTCLCLSVLLHWFVRDSVFGLPLESMSQQRSASILIVQMFVHVEECVAWICACACTVCLHVHNSQAAVFLFRLQVCSSAACFFAHNA